MRAVVTRVSSASVTIGVGDFLTLVEKAGA